MIHLYCGNGKGKTTCALGLALRAAGADMNVVIVQFLKGSHTCELDSLKKLPNITMLRNSKNYGFASSMTDEQLAQVKSEHNKNLSDALQLISDGKCDLLILDELTYVYAMNLADKSKIEQLIINAPENLEIVVTGRDPDKIFFNNADYITEMKQIRHPYDKGVPARKGIEF